MDDYSAFEEFLQHIGDLAGGIVGGDLGSMLGGKRAPTSENPADYPRSKQIDHDEDARLLNIKFESLSRGFRMALTEAQTQWLELQAARNRLHLYLEKTYPEIVVSNGGGFGVRRYDGSLWVVGWNSKHQE